MHCIPYLFLFLSQPSMTDSSCSPQLTLRQLTDLIDALPRQIHLPARPRLVVVLRGIDPARRRLLRPYRPKAKRRRLSGKPKTPPRYKICMVCGHTVHPCCGQGWFV